MKSSCLFLLAIFFVLNINLIAQPWNIGGNTIGANDFIGGLYSSNLNPINFKFQTSTPTIYQNLMQINTNGNTGIGNFSLFTPQRQLDIYNANNPQLRLTYNYGNQIFTDFLTEANGNLIIFPTNITTQKNVGINLTTTPTEMLDVLGNGRFENIPNASGSNYSFVLAQNSAGSAQGTLAGIDFSTIAQNGLEVNTSSLKIELGSNIVNDPSASLLHDTYVPMFNSGSYNNLWW